MAAHNWDLAAIVWLHPFCAVTLGSEFHQTKLLAPLCWTPASHSGTISLSGSILGPTTSQLLPILEPNRLRDMHVMLSRRNHKSAKLYQAKLIPMLQDEVAGGWQLPLPLEAAMLIPVAP